MFLLLVSSLHTDMCANFFSRRKRLEAAGYKPTLCPTCSGWGVIIAYSHNDGCDVDEVCSECGGTGLTLPKTEVSVRRYRFRPLADSIGKPTDSGSPFLGVTESDILTSINATEYGKKG